jgi:hypothetical protein
MGRSVRGSGFGVKLILDPTSPGKANVRAPESRYGYQGVTTSRFDAVNPPAASW